MIEQRDKKGRIIRATGRSAGSKNKRPNIHSLLPPDALQQLYSALFQLALSGDTAAGKLLLDRLDPVPKGRPVELPEVPLPIDGIEGAQQAGRRVLETMLGGALSPDEAAQMLSVITQQVVGLEARDWSKMLLELQERAR